MVKKPVVFLEKLAENEIIPVAFKKGYTVSCTGISSSYLCLTLIKDADNLNSIKFIDIYLHANKNGIKAYARAAVLGQPAIVNGEIWQPNIDIIEPQKSLERIINSYEKMYSAIVQMYFT